jgi:hydrogenase maturation protein HypF
MPPALSITCRGLVQGVGFRPFVWRLATRLGLAGWVLNAGDGVRIHVEGGNAAEFLGRLPKEAPALSRIDAIDAQAAEFGGFSGFAIRDSVADEISTAIGTDLGICPDCLAELFDPQSRRHRYPSIACTRCGPRYTAIWSLPYRREATTLAGWPLCPACQAEYEDPADRRFHAETSACPDCGPGHGFFTAKGAAVPGDAAAHAFALLRQGGILAVKGLGGFHLACDATNAEAVARLRARKRRPQKPFAVMAPNLASLKAWVEISPEAEARLASPARPIVLCPLKAALPGIAPGLDLAGVMLPSTPMQWLLFHEAAGRPPGLAWTQEAQEALFVMTSGNAGGNPLAAGNAEALEGLKGIADGFWLNERPIAVRADDSLIGANGLFIRRARGFVPEPLPFAGGGLPILAVGAQLKDTLCITRGNEAFLSQHIGDLGNPATAAWQKDLAGHLLESLAVRPRLLACDLHPDFPSTRLAEALAEGFGAPLLRIPHHAAHLAGVAAEHGIAAAPGLALDGFGLGEDGGAWGGELLDLQADGSARRLGHLKALTLPGGDAAARGIWRIAAALLLEQGVPEDAIAARFPGVPADAMQAVLAMVRARVRCVPSSSLGRVFDAAAALLGVAQENSFEGEAPMKLEALARRGMAESGLAAPGGAQADGAGGKAVLASAQGLGQALACPQGSLGTAAGKAAVLDLRPLLLSLAGEADPARGAARFHVALAESLAAWAAGQVPAGAQEILLSGGCLQNALFSGLLCEAFKRCGKKPVLPVRVPPGDGGIAYGQAVLAARLAASRAASISLAESSRQRPPR